MKNNIPISEIAKSTLKLESEAIAKLADFIDQHFENAVKHILASKSRVIITGIGKSAIIAQKIVATLNSTGTPSIFLHAADAIHGDIGIIQNNDVLICISKSGNTPEIKVLVPLLKEFGNKLIAITGNVDSYLAKNADFILNTFVEKEACPNNLAPTCSTTAQLAMGDALAVALLTQKGFKAEDFAKFHPGGSLGKKLYLRVENIYPQNEKPFVNPNASLKQVIIEISQKRLGACAVVENNILKGIITDGDIRRLMEKEVDFNAVTAKDIMSANPKTILPNELAINALHMLEKNKITQLIVAENNKYLGIIHLHDLLREGII